MRAGNGAGVRCCISGGGGGLKSGPTVHPANSVNSASFNGAANDARRASPPIVEIRTDPASLRLPKSFMARWRPFQHSKYRVQKQPVLSMTSSILVFFSPPRPGQLARRTSFFRK
jgi:hypothetical protein